MRSNGQPSHQDSGSPASAARTVAARCRRRGCPRCASPVRRRDRSRADRDRRARRGVRSCRRAPRRRRARASRHGRRAAAPPAARRRPARRQSPSRKPGSSSTPRGRSSRTADSPMRAAAMPSPQGARDTLDAQTPAVHAQGQRRAVVSRGEDRFPAAGLRMPHTVDPPLRIPEPSGLRAPRVASAPRAGAGGCAALHSRTRARRRGRASRRR